MTRYFWPCADFDPGTFRTISEVCQTELSSSYPPDKIDIMLITAVTHTINIDLNMTVTTISFTNTRLGVSFEKITLDLYYHTLIDTTRTILIKIEKKSLLMGSSMTSWYKSFKTIRLVHIYKVQSVIHSQTRWG